MIDIDTGTDDLLARIDEHVGVITFNRPERRNALSDPMYTGIERALDVFRDAPVVRVVLVTGNGGAFCAGGDVKGFHAANTGGGPPATGRTDPVERLRRNQRTVSQGFHEFRCPVVAALPGPAAGAGLSMALAADIRLAAERALLVTAFADVGASGDFGGSWFLEKLVGPAKAKELYFTSPRLTAAEALTFGLVNQVMPDDGFDAAALQWCHDLALKAPIALALMKQNINRAATVDLAAALDAEAVAMMTSMSTADHREASAAFVEKRRPTFIGE